MEPPGSCNADEEFTALTLPPPPRHPVPPAGGCNSDTLSGKWENAALQLKTDIQHITLKYQSDLNTRLDAWMHDSIGDGLTVPIPELQDYRSPSKASKRERIAAASLPFPVLPGNGFMKQLKHPKYTHSQGLGSERSERKTKTKKKNDFLLAEVRKECATHFTPLQHLTNSVHYEVFSVFLIFSNAIFIGWECQYMAERARDDAAAGLVVREDAPTVFVALGFIFTILFFVELALRWIADGFFQFLQTTEIWWNLLDIVIVVFGLLDTFLEIIVELTHDEGESSTINVTSNVSVIRVLRVVRVVRVAKVIRVMRFFRELRIMLYSIIGSLKSLLWVMLILGMMFYVFGICFTVAATMKLSAANRTHPLFLYFGTLDTALLSLYMSMSGGNDWGLYYDALMGLGFQYRLIFLLFISFSIFAVVNIVTGVFVDSAFKGGESDRQVVVMEELEAKKAYLSSMREIFEEMDTDCTGCLTLKEFEQRLDDERVIAYFNALKLDVSDARTLFMLLDFDQSEEVSVDEFLSGCYKLQGESRSLDMKIMQCEVRFLKKNFEEVAELVHDIHAHLHVPDIHVQSAKQ